MKLRIQLGHEDKIFEESKILSDIEINTCVCGVGNLLHTVLAKMENEVIKKFLDNSTKYGPSELKDKE